MAEVAPTPTVTAEQFSASYDSSIVVRRWGSTVLDYLLLGGVALALLLLPETAQGTALALFALGVLAYFPLLEFRFGATPGKLVCRTRVVGADGRRPTVGQAVVRSLLRLVEINPVLMGGIPAGIVVLASKKRQRLGDLAAGTFVLRAEDARYLEQVRAHRAGERDARTGALAPAPPPPRPLSPPPAAVADRWLAPTQRSGWAIAAGYLGLFALLVVPAPFALGAGLLALRDLRRQPGLGGKGRAIFGVVMGSVFTLLLILVLVVAAGGPK